MTTRRGGALTKRAADDRVLEKRSRRRLERLLAGAGTIESPRLAAVLIADLEELGRAEAARLKAAAPHDLDERARAYGAGSTES